MADEADSPRSNAVLGQLLEELGWSPRALGRRLNRRFGAGTVAETAPYHWRDQGRVPRPPVPGLVAHLLSCEAGRRVTVSELWQGKAAESPLMVPADGGLHQSWSRRGTLNAIDDWVVSGLLDRRQFLAISGANLTAIPAEYLNAGPSKVVCPVENDSGGPLIEQIEQSIPHLQRLDDASGGGRHLAYVGAQFRSVALLLRDGEIRPKAEARLFRALSEIGQLAGWMAFDAGHHGWAQRYFFTALRAARESGYESMAAHIVADLAFQAATREHPADAVVLGESAARMARSTPTGVRASVNTRLAYGYAVSGDLHSFDRTYRAAVEMLTDSGTAEDPAWMYYLTPGHLDTQAGYALVHAGTLALDDDRSAAKKLLRRGDRLLRNGAHAVAMSHSGQRRAMFEGAWLANAAAARGNLEEACELGRTALARAATVRSVRSFDVLRRLASRLRSSTRNEYVRDFQPELEAELSRHQGTVV